MKVTPTGAPPAGAVKAADPFITPSQLFDRPQPVDVHRPQPVGSPQSTDQVPAMQRQVSSTLVTETVRQLTYMDTDSNVNPADRPHTV